MHIWNVEEWRHEVSVRQLRWWMAYYRIEPWGQPWRIAGRAVSLLRTALGIPFDRHTEDRFLVTYREGDETRPARPQTDAEIESMWSKLPNMKKREK